VLEPERTETTLRYFFERRNAVPALLADTAVFRKGICTKMLPPGAIFELKLHKNAFAAEDPWGLGSLQRSPDPLAGFQGTLRGREGREEREWDGKKRGGKGSVFPLLFLQFNRTRYG